MSVASSPPPSHSTRRFRYPVVLAATGALGAGVALAPHASASDNGGPGYLIPDSTGEPDSSHIGAYNVTGVDGITYCADPQLAGPDAADGYGPARPVTTWTSKTTGKPASAEDLARAAYVLGKHGQTKNDEQAATVTDGKTADVAVKDVQIAVQPKPNPRPAVIPVLPQTGA